MRTAVVVIQGLTFVALGALLLREGNWKLGTAQVCLALVTVLIYG